MKTVYLIRHGQTDSNVRNVPGHRTDPLSELGQQQAGAVAERLKEINIDLMLASPYIRAHQTAEVIAQSLMKEIVLEPLFEEQKAVSALRGMSRSDPYGIQVRHELVAHVYDPSWHHSDEENFFDIKLRAEKALQLLEDRPEENILVVTHGAFLRALARVIILGDLFTPATYKVSYHAFGLSNAGVTVFEFVEDRGWQIVRWNDTVHLSPELNTHD